MRQTRTSIFPRGHHTLTLTLMQHQQFMLIVKFAPTLEGQPFSSSLVRNKIIVGVFVVTCCCHPHTTTITMLSSFSSSRKRHGVVTPYTVVSNLDRRPRPLQYPATPPQQHDCHSPGGGPVNLLALLQTPTPTSLSIDNMFTFSPFGLCCRRPECRIKPQIEATERSIQIHLKKHAKSTDDYRLPIVLKFLGSFHQEVEKARASGNIDEYRQNNVEYKCFTCICGRTFPNKKQNAIRHCKKSGCDLTNIQNESAIKLRCGRYVTQSQLATFFSNNAPYINQQFDYDMARRVLDPFLLEVEKNDHVYTPMYLPLIMQCGSETMFVSKIKSDFVMIHSPPDLIRERLLITIHERAEKWLCYYCQKNILMVPGNLRAGLQTFEGGEVNEVSQKTTYTMQHNPKAAVLFLDKISSGIDIFTRYIMSRFYYIRSRFFICPTTSRAGFLIRPATS